MFKSIFTVTALTLSLTASSAHAYLSPADVFTELENAQSQPTAEQQQQPNQAVPNTQPAVQDPVVEEPAVEEPAAEEPAAQTQPTFFRSGEQIEQSTESEQGTTTDTTESPFEEEPAVLDQSDILIPSLPTTNGVDEESEAILQEMQEDALEEGGEEGEGEDEVQQTAAPQKKSMAVALLGRMKYLGGGLIFVGIGYGFFSWRRRKKGVASSGVAAAAGDAKHPNIPAPEQPQQVEETSERLEHALEAMGQKPATEASEESTDDSVGFSDTPLPGQEEKPQ